MWVISHGSKIYPGSWARNSVEKNTRNSFVTGRYTLNKNYKIFYDYLREKKIINYISILQMPTSARAQNWRPRLNCRQINDYAIRLPSEDDKWHSFKNHCRKKRMPFVIYVDLECTLEELETEDPTISYQQHHRHQVISIAYYIHCSYDSLCMYRFCRGNGYVAWFAEELRKIAHNIKSII